MLRENRAEADDVFEAFGNRHIEFDDFVLRHKKKEAGRGIWRRWHKDANRFPPGFLLHFVVLFVCKETDGVHAFAWEFHEHHSFE